MQKLSPLLALAVACAGASPEAGEIVAPAPAEDPCLRSGQWGGVAPISLAGRADHTAIWTGSEMVVWGGAQGMRSPKSDGARYQPATNRWEPMSPDNAPAERDDHAAVWTGSEMIVWGGNRYSERSDKLDSGGRYDPMADRWSPTSDSGLTARDDPRAVWTGSEMIVWGGRDALGHAGDGARYQPSQDHWRPVSTSGAPDPREDHTAVWTGREMIVWGGWNGPDDERRYGLGGGRYDPATDTWLPISREGAPEPREDHAAVWTGTEMIVWGGMVRRGTKRVQLDSGGRYNPATDTWTSMGSDVAPSAREDAVVVWTGSEVIVWGGQQAGVPLDSGARYVPSASRWCEIPASGAPSARRDHAGVWTGESLVFWGGRASDGEYPASGAAYVP